MRFGGNFNPEWGYLASAPSFVRTARIVVVATAIGATAGAAVVLSLVDRPQPLPAAGAGNTLVVVHSLVQPAEAAAPAVPAAPLAAPVASAAVAPPVTAQLPAAASESHSIATPAMPSAPAMPASATALAESPPAQPPSEAAVPLADNVGDDAAAPKTKKLPGAGAAGAAPAPAGQQAQHGPLAIVAAPKRKPTSNDGFGTILRRLFSAHSGSTFAN